MAKEPRHSGLLPQAAGLIQLGVPNTIIGQIDGVGGERGRLEKLPELPNLFQRRFSPLNRPLNLLKGPGLTGMLLEEGREIAGEHTLEVVLTPFHCQGNEVPTHIS